MREGTESRRLEIASGLEVALAMLSNVDDPGHAAVQALSML
jgi:hypothetical protein